MATYSNSLAQLIEYTARIYGDWRGGTLTGGSTSTIVDTGRDEVDDYFQNTSPISKVRIVTTTDGAAPQGETRRFTDWVQSTGTGTITPVFTASTAANDTYAILSELEWSEVKSKINLAIDRVAERALLFDTDTTIITAASTYEYDIPSRFIYIYRVSQADSVGDYDATIPADQWRIVRAATPRLHLIRSSYDHEDEWYGATFADDPITASRTIRIEGLTTPSKLTNDVDVSYVNPVYLSHQAAAFLHYARVRRVPPDYDEHRAQAEICQAVADRELALSIAFQLPVNAKKVRE